MVVLSFIAVSAIMIFYAEATTGSSQAVEMATPLISYYYFKTSYFIGSGIGFGAALAGIIREAREKQNRYQEKRRSYDALKSVVEKAENSLEKHYKDVDTDKLDRFIEKNKAAITFAMNP
jgi:hypothetical protein